MVYRLSLGGEEDAEQVLRGPLAETGATARFVHYKRRTPRRTTTDSGRDLKYSNNDIFAWYLFPGPDRLFRRLLGILQC